MYILYAWFSCECTGSISRGCGDISDTGGSQGRGVLWKVRECRARLGKIPAHSDVLISIGRVLGTILACRMLINIRKTTIGHETQVSSLSALQFELQTRTGIKTDVTEQAFHSSSPSPVR
jgi:hypothetical protein